MKKPFGKTVLLFPGHSFEGTGDEYDKEKFVEQIMDCFSKKYHYYGRKLTHDNITNIESYVQKQQWLYLGGKHERILSTL